ncbi:MAG: ligase-associated DNA damage response exonuclease [Gemmatimonadaceae bacterium]|nr:ligase-associated DNA damage response exonuclease [Gemmatimonadaceae bacterium]
MAPLLQLTSHGLYCEAADCFIDPWSPVARALITHAHGDHLVSGCDAYLVAREGEQVSRERLGTSSRGLQAIAYGETRVINDVRVSFHPAGHILGSAQIRLERGGEVWVVSGDYKTDPDPTCTPWEPVRCHTFITESTFGLPIYRWPSQDEVFRDINSWWRTNAEEGVTSVLYGYALGKAQRMLAGLDPTIGPILTHGAVEKMTDCYRDAGVALPPTTYATLATRADDWSRAIVIAPPSADGSSWTRRFGETRAAFASGWMLVRGARRRRGVNRGFVLSDHVDWPQLLHAIDATRAESVWVTHGFTGPVVQWLTSRGINATAIATRFEGERDDTTSTAESSVAGFATTPSPDGDAPPSPSATIPQP